MSTLDPFTSPLPFVFVDHANAPQEALAHALLTLDRPNPRDLSHCTIWCESTRDIHTIKRSLIHAGQSIDLPQLLLPEITTLQDWLWQQNAPTQVVVSETNKQLLLVEAIRQSPSLFHTSNPWPLAKELVTLFNECTLAQLPLHDGEQALREVLQTSYQYPAANTVNISRESEIVYRLWQAYREQIQAHEWLDPIDLYCQQLASPQAVPSAQPAHNFFLLGKARLCTAEVHFLQRLHQAHTVCVFAPRVSHQQQVVRHHPHMRFIAQDETPQTASTTREQALDIIYTRGDHVLARSQQLSQLATENIFANWLSIYTCQSIEAHVNAVCIQAKQWLLEGLQSIGIIVNDRLLARRIRAVLDEQGIQPTDLGGWTLSTTSAATSIEVLLDAIEYRFNKNVLLDLLSSPFLPANHAPDSPYARQVAELKQHLHKHRSTSNDTLDTLTELARRYFSKQQHNASELDDTLTLLKSACETLQSCQGTSEYALADLSDHLLSTLKALGMYEVLHNDIAGEQLLETFASHIQSTRNSTIRINWKEWRQWLRDLFENNYFIPVDTDPRITLCSFEHTDNLKFDASIIAGAEETRLTNSKNQRTFFNEKVCHELNLPTRHETNAINFVRFRQLLLRSDKVLLSAEIDNHGEPQELCSWVTLLNVFCQQTYASTLFNPELDALLHACKQHSQNANAVTLDKTRQPHPPADRELIPTLISSTHYQALLNCPYQYFAKYVLSLRDQDAKEDFTMSEFGTLVHACLHEFHFGEDNKTATGFLQQHRKTLIDELSQLSTTLFMQAAFPTSTKQGWLQRWQSNIPAYVQWAIERAQDWHTVKGEATLQQPLNDTFTLNGKLDRLDSDTQHFSVIDYKTGSSSITDKEVVNGEQVQLPFYALLDDNITQAAYLTLSKQGEVKLGASIDADKLAQLKGEHQSRLETLLNALLNETELSAHGDDKTCSYCSYHGLCRKQHWNN